ncbi:hypothetical protein EG329_000346 [Mollisiaceae sp. DMI_Dod_QoI]|nr:hypothetical protein EG329_000346 [Helotiales sp. DMI_Dod_QoI]
MPPKKAQASAKPRKPASVPKIAPRASFKKNAASASKPSKRKRSPSPAPKEVRVWERNITTQAQRERKRFKLSMSSMHEEIDEEYIASLAKTLVGESRDTWGIPEQQPIKAVTGKKQKSRRVPNAFQATEDRWMNMMEDIQSMQPVKKPTILNCPNRSPILRISLEVREEIYSYLLIYPKPIMVKQDWTTVERNPFVDHSIILTCKQFAVEASAFLYRNNTFQALLRRLKYQFRLYEPPTLIRNIYHTNIRNLAIDCSRDCWNLDWHEKAAKGITTLVSAKAVITSLTLILNPQRVGMSTTALGTEARPITFADFLWYPGPLVTAIRMLAPRMLKIVIKKGGSRRFGMEVDMRYLQAGQLEAGLLVNPETIRSRERNVRLVETQLMGLKERFEEAFEDDERAVAEGKCTLLADDEFVNAVACQPLQPMAEKSGKEEGRLEEGGEEDPITISSRSSSEEPSDSGD